MVADRRERTDEQLSASELLPKTTLHDQLTKQSPQDSPRWPQDGPKTAQDGPKMAQDGPKMAPRRPKTAHDGIIKSLKFIAKNRFSQHEALLRLSWLQDGSRWLRDCPKTAQDGPRWSQDSPRWPQDGPKTAQDGPKMGEDGEDGRRICTSSLHEAASERQDAVSEGRESGFEAEKARGISVRVR